MPRWFSSKGKVENAREVLTSIRPPNYNVDGEEKNVQEIIKNVGEFRNSLQVADRVLKHQCS